MFVDYIKNQCLLAVLSANLRKNNLDFDNEERINIHAQEQDVHTEWYGNFFS